MKGKEVIGHDNYDEDEAHTTRKGPRIKGLKRALELEKQQEALLVEELTFEERISMEINEDRDFGSTE